MLAAEIIRTKRDHHALSEAQIQGFVRGLVDGSWSEGQVAALAMAVLLNGMGRDECVALTRAMTLSGQVLRWPTAAGSRPVVDQEWLPTTRLVGKSGKQVKPKLYLALGISGAPEHAEGMRDAELIVAINRDEKAPIFGLAQVGAAVDVLELMPALTERIQQSSKV